MKKLIIYLVMILTSCTVQSNLISSKDGYALQIDKYNHELKAGESTTINVDVLRSSAYLNKPVKLKIISPLPDGLSISIAPQPVMLDKATIEVNTSSNVKHGVYTITLSGDALIASMPAKGILFKLSIN